MESYHKRKKVIRREIWQINNFKPYNDDNGIVANRQQKYIKQIIGITDEEGLRLAYATKDGLYQHYNKLFIAGTKDFPTDHIDDSNLPFDDTLNKPRRGRDADAQYRSHHEIDTGIGHSLGGAVALSLENRKKKVTTHMGSFNLRHSVLQLYQVTYQIHY